MTSKIDDLVEKFLAVYIDECLESFFDKNKPSLREQFFISEIQRMLLHGFIQRFFDLLAGFPGGVRLGVKVFQYVEKRFS